MGPRSYVQSVAQEITRRFGLHKCLDCAEALEAEFIRIGVSGKILKLEAMGSRPYIVMNDVDFKLPWGSSASHSITENNVHYGVRVGNTVFDNVHKSGIKYNDWQASFTCDGGRFKLGILRAFGPRGA